MNVLRDDFYNPLNETNECESSLVIFKDVIFNPRIMKVAADCFARGRHKNLSLIFCTQNLFLTDTAYRTITLNFTVTSFRIWDIRQVTSFGKTYLAIDKIAHFIVVFKMLVYEEGTLSI